MDGSTQSRPPHLRWLPETAVAAAALLPFLSTLRFQFVYDDLGQIVSNDRIRSWSYLPNYFTEHVWAHMPGIAATFYRPLFLLWLRLNYAFFGLHAGYWHLASILAHAAVSVLLYRFVSAVSRDRILSFAAALIFAVHPVHVESVAWVSGTTDVLLALATFSMLLFLLPETEASRWNQPLALMAFGAATLVKETGVMLLFLTFVVAFGGATNRRLAAVVRQTFPFVAVLGGYLALRIFALSGTGATTASVSFAMWTGNIPRLLWWYLQNLLWPAQLSAFHDFQLDQFSARSFALPAFAIGAVALAIWALWKWVARTPEERRLCAFAAMLVLLPLIPVLKLSSLDLTNLVHERYLYLPSAGLAIIVAIGARRLISLLPSPEPGIVLLLGLAAMLAVVTNQQSRFWRDEITLYTRALQTAPRNVAVRNNLGAALIEGGRCDQALPILRGAVEMDSKDWLAYSNMGECAVEHGNWPLAESYYNHAVELNPLPALVERLTEVRNNGARAR